MSSARCYAPGAGDQQPALHQVPEARPGEVHQRGRGLLGRDRRVRVGPASTSDSAAPTSACASPATSRSGSAGSPCASLAAAAIRPVTNATISSRMAVTSTTNGSPPVRAWLCRTAQPSGWCAVCVKNARSPSHSCRSAPLRRRHPRVRRRPGPPTHAGCTPRRALPWSSDRGTPAVSTPRRAPRCHPSTRPGTHAPRTPAPPRRASDAPARPAASAWPSLRPPRPPASLHTASARKRSHHNARTPHHDRREPAGAGCGRVRAWGLRRRHPPPEARPRAGSLPRAPRRETRWRCRTSRGPGCSRGRPR